MKTANTSPGEAHYMSLSDKLARSIALRLVYLQKKLAKAANRFINRLPPAYQWSIFIAAGSLFTAMLIYGMLSGSPLPAIQGKPISAYHIGQASGTPGGLHPAIQSDTTNKK